MYKYHGNRATGICVNGHFTVAPFRECKTCGEQVSKILLVTKATRLKVVINGFLAKNGYALVIYEDGTHEYHSEWSMYNNFVCTNVIDQALFFSRVFSWGICIH